MKTVNVRKSKSESVSFVGEADAMTQPAASQQLVPGGDIDGEVDASDIKLPQLVLKHAVDPRFSEITPGNFVYSIGGEEAYPLVPPLTIIALSIRKGYLQKAEPGEIPIRCWSKKEVEEAGGTLEPGQPDLLLFVPFGDIMLLIAGLERTERSAGVMFLDVAGEKFAPAVYRTKGTAFNETAKALITWETFQRMKGNQNARLIDYRWQLGVARRSGASVSYLVPTLKRGTEHGSALIAALRDVAANL
jgi:hypothetical protein